MTKHDGLTPTHERIFKKMASADDSSTLGLSALKVKLEGLQRALAKQTAAYSAPKWSDPAMIGSLGLPPFSADLSKNESFTEYRQQFDLLARGLGFVPQQKACVLPTLLRGHALDVYSDLPKEVQQDYPTLVQHLEKQLDSPELMRFARLELRNRKMEVGESIDDFASAIRALVQRAFKGVDAATRDSLALDHFTAGLKFK